MANVYMDGLATVDFGEPSGGGNAAGAATGAAPIGEGSFPVSFARSGMPGGPGAAAQPPVLASAGLQASPTFGHRMAVDVQPFSVAPSWADALRLYLDTLTQPPQWNAWQSVAYSLTRLYDEEFDQLGRHRGYDLVQVP